MGDNNISPKINRCLGMNNINNINNNINTNTNQIHF